MLNTANSERVPTALESFISNLSSQLERLAKNNSRIKSINDRFFLEEPMPSNKVEECKMQDGILPSLEKYSNIFQNLLNEQEGYIEKTERFV